MPPNTTLPLSMSKTVGTTPNNITKTSAIAPQHASSQTTNTAPNANPLKLYQILSGAQLKYIAFISMLIDHTNNTLITPMLNGKGALLYISNAFSIIGRIAFPIFMFFLIEGFFKTRNRKKYLVNLLIFGLISEIPFDMFVSRTFFEPNWNNMMFTLALCLDVIWLIDSLRDKLKNTLLWVIASLLVLGISCFIAAWLSLDYDYHAILVAYIFSIFRKKPIIGAGLGYISIIKEIWSILGFGLTLTYNGERGRQYKWLNYAFYPVHLLILGILRFYLNI